jgi:hypothetical protein
VHVKAPKDLTDCQRFFLEPTSARHRKMRGYADAQARVIFRDLIDMPATVEVTDKEVQVRFDRRAHLPIVLASGLLDSPVDVPWWNGMRLRLTA